MWGVVFVSSPLISPCASHARILNQSQHHLTDTLSLFLPPISAASCLLLRHVMPSSKISSSPRPAGRFGQTLRSTPKSNTTPNSNKQQSEQKILEEEGVQLSGSDVLWALQKATVRRKQQQQQQMKKKKMEKMKMKVSSDSSIGNKNPPKDYSKVKPLCVKSDWGNRLDELEKLLKDLPQTI